MKTLKLPVTITTIQMLFIFGIFGLACEEQDPPRGNSGYEDVDTDIESNTDDDDGDDNANFDDDDDDNDSDTGADTGSDISETGDSAVTLRADYLKLREPRLWTPGLSGPTVPEVSNKADQSLANGLVGDTTPKDGNYDISLIVRLDTLAPGKESGDAVFSSGLCPVDGSPCSFDPNAEQQIGEYQKRSNEPCEENKSVLPPCIENEPIDTTLILGQFGRIQLKQATMAASYKKKASQGVERGIIRGFVTEETARRINIKEESFGINMKVKLNKMLKDEESVVVKGKKGWWFVYSFEASPVEFKEE